MNKMYSPRQTCAILNIDKTTYDMLVKGDILEAVQWGTGCSRVTSEKAIRAAAQKMQETGLWEIDPEKLEFPK